MKLHTLKTLVQFPGITSRVHQLGRKLSEPLEAQFPVA